MQGGGVPLQCAGFRLQGVGVQGVGCQGVGCQGVGVQGVGCQGAGVQGVGFRGQSCTASVGQLARLKMQGSAFRDQGLAFSV